MNCDFNYNPEPRWVTSSLSFPPSRSEAAGRTVLWSPPRLRRMPNRRSEKNNSNSGNISTNQSHDDSSASSLWANSRSPSPPITNCTVADYRRRLNFVKEQRRARQQQFCTDSPTPPCQLSSSWAGCGDEGLGDCSSSPPLVRGKLSKPLSPWNESTVSTCPTSDEVDTSMDSTRMWQPHNVSYELAPPPPRLVQAAGQDHNARCPDSSLPPCAGGGQGNPGRVCYSVRKKGLTLDRLLCTSSSSPSVPPKNVDTSFAQIRDTICRSASKENETARVPGVVVAWKSVEEKDDEYRPSLDQMPPSNSREPFSPRRNRQNESFDSTMRMNQPQDETFFERRRSVGIDEFASHQMTSRSTVSPRTRRAENYASVMERECEYHDDDDDDYVPSHPPAEISTESEEIPLRSGRKNPWFRKDPWYVRPQGSGDETEKLPHYHGNAHDDRQEVLDRMMHAVVFVTDPEL